MFLGDQVLEPKLTLTTLCALPLGQGRRRWREEEEEDEEGGMERGREEGEEGRGTGRQEGGLWGNRRQGD